MFDLAWSEIAIIGAVTLVVVGPKDLPVVLRTAGRWVARARSMAREFQSNVDQMIRDAELDELHKQVRDIGAINPLASFDRPVDVHPVPEPPIAPAPDMAPETTSEMAPGAGPAPTEGAAQAEPHAAPSATPAAPATAEPRP